MKWWLAQKIERLIGHKVFWRIARKFNQWIDLTEYYGCRKKIDFKSEERSKQSAQKMNDSGKARNELEAYHCKYCDGWHIGRLD